MISIKTPITKKENVKKFKDFLNSKAILVEKIHERENYSLFVTKNEISEETEELLKSLNCEISKFKNIEENSELNFSDKLDYNIGIYIESLHDDMLERVEFDVVIRTTLLKSEIKEKFKNHEFTFYPNLGSTIIVHKINAKDIKELCSDPNIVSIRVPVESRLRSFK